MTLRFRPLTDFAPTRWPFRGLPMFGFNFIMADPPWRFETWSDAGKAEKSPEVHYRTMTIEDIAAMPVGHLADKDCILWLWATHPMIEQQLEVMRRWGFRYVTGGEWVKRTKHGKIQFGTGYRLRSSSEPFLIGTNGDPHSALTIRNTIETFHEEGEVFDGPIGRHSEKPDIAYQTAEAMMPGATRADLFSRRTRKGWTAFGDEAGKHDPVAA